MSSQVASPSCAQEFQAHELGNQDYSRVFAEWKFIGLQRPIEFVFLVSSSVMAHQRFSRVRFGLSLEEII